MHTQSVDKTYGDSEPKNKGGEIWTKNMHESRSVFDTKMANAMMNANISPHIPFFSNKSAI